MRRKQRSCHTPEKLQYATRETAEYALGSTHWKHTTNVPIRVYWCPAGHYHLTGKG